MSRPRIRSTKPEMRKDERYGRLSIPARETFNGLITLADDEGRQRAVPAMLAGDIFPYDALPAAKINGWVEEITATGMLLAYECDGIPYLAFRHWARHQRIDKPAPSELPAPPDPLVVAENAVIEDDGKWKQAAKVPGAVQELSRNVLRIIPDESKSVPAPRARSRIGSDRIGSKRGGEGADAARATPPSPSSMEGGGAT